MARYLLFANCLFIAAHQISLAQSTDGVTLNLSQYPNIRSAGDVIEKWNPDQHLYVKGDLGIGTKQLESLEQWLDEQAPQQEGDSA